MRSIYIGAALAASLTVAAQAHAQLLNTWVSATGDDDNPCSRALPCATFRGAILKTDAGGQISVIDSGEYGTVEITKSITIDGGGSLASIQTSSVLRSGVLVNAGPNDRVVLRNLSINGSHNLDQGVLFQSGRRLTIENCLFSRFDSETAIFVANRTRSNLDLNNVLIFGDMQGVGITRPHGINDPPGFVIATAKNLHVETPGERSGGFALSAVPPSSGTITDSLFASYGYPTTLVRSSVDLNLDDTVLVHSGVPFSSGGVTDQMRLSENLIMNHGRGESARTFTYGNNAVAGILRGGVNASPIGFQ